MRIAIIHYHLQRGGVTRVIEHAVRALTAAGVRVAVLTGRPPDAAFPRDIAVATVDGLDYHAGRGQPAALARRMRAAARRVLGGTPDVWHIHNHSLGKNPALTAAVRLLARGGARLLLQMHDFAEDGRPAEFRRLARHLADDDLDRVGDMLYPQAPHIHYAVLNSRDEKFFRHAGVPECRLHRLPNPVDAAGRPPRRHPTSGEPLWLYPTRAIRRKNLGEFLLLAARTAPASRFAVTLAPDNPAARPVYEAWVRLAHRLKLPVDFEVGRRPDVTLASLLATASAAVTTSVGEGFGLAFLEPWLAGCPVAGRDLPEVTDGFKADGLDFSGLYEQLNIPAAWLNGRELRARIRSGIHALHAAYGRAAKPADVARALSAAARDGLADFGRLDESLQARVLKNICAGKYPARDIVITPDFPVCAPPGVIARNRRIIRRKYNIKGYGARLMNIYTKLADVPPAAVGMAADVRFSMNALLDDFLAPERFFLLRT